MTYEMELMIAYLEKQFESVLVFGTRRKAGDTETTIIERGNLAANFGVAKRWVLEQEAMAEEKARQAMADGEGKRAWGDRRVLAAMLEKMERELAAQRLARVAGGKERARRMGAGRRREVARKAARARWNRRKAK